MTRLDKTNLFIFLYFIAAPIVGVAIWVPEVWILIGVFAGFFSWVTIGSVIAERIEKGKWRWPK